MPFYHTLGEVPPKRHIAFRRPDGQIYHEQLMGNFGFSGPASLLYHLRPPTAVKSSLVRGEVRLEANPDKTLRLRHFRTGKLPRGGSASLNRIPVLFNDDAVISHVFPDAQDDHFFRNGTADELIFVAQGAGVLESSFGELDYKEGDQLIIPRGVTYRLRLGESAHRLFVLESRDYLRTPRRYRNDFGQLKEGAPLNERSMRRPSRLPVHDESGDFCIVVKQHTQLHEVHIDHHPFDVVGWDGYYFPWAFSIHDFEPIAGMIHQPPPVHQILEAQQLVVCDFCPRPFDFHPEAVPAPYNHTNVMSDEVLIYVSEEFMSRKGIEYGSITLHPDGMPHGPHPGRYEGSIGKKRTDELALMIDTFRPLRVAVSALAAEDQEYYLSWLESSR